MSNDASVQFTNDGSALLAATGNRLNSWAAPEFKMPKKSAFPGGRVQFLSDEQGFAIVAIKENSRTSYQAALFDLENGIVWDTLQLPMEYPKLASINPTRTTIAAFGGDGLQFISFPDGKIIRSTPAHTGHIEDSQFSGLQFIQNDKLLLTSGRDGTLCEWNGSTGELIRTYTGSGKNKSIESFCVSPDESIVAISFSHAIMLLDSTSWSGVLTIPRKNRVHWSSMAISSDNRLLAFATTHSNDTHVYNIESCNIDLTLRGHTSGIASVCFSPNGQFLATTSHDDTLKVWKLPTLAKRICRK